MAGDLKLWKDAAPQPGHWSVSFVEGYVAIFQPSVQPSVEKAAATTKAGMSADMKLCSICSFLSAGTECQDRAKYSGPEVIKA